MILLKRGNMMSIYAEHPQRAIFQVIQSRGAKVCLILLVLFSVAALLVSCLWPAYRGLPYLLYLTSLCNTFLPIAPHEPVILLYGNLYPPWLVAIYAGVAVSVIEIVNYYILLSILNLEKMGAFRKTRAYQHAEHYFSRFAFPSLLFACVVPMPFAPFRVLAAATRYPVKNLVFCVFMGKTLRFYLLALAGEALSIPIWAYAIVAIAAFAIVLARRAIEFWSKA